MLVAVVFGIAAVSVFGLQDHGVQIVGEIPDGLPRPAFPASASATSPTSCRTRWRSP